MSQRPALLIALCIVSLILCLPLVAQGTSAVRMSLADLTAVSSTVVYGTVVDTRSRWNDARSLIVTDVRVRVLDAVKGGMVGEVIVTQPGGELGKLKTEVPGAAAFRRGEEAVLFLADDGRGGFHLTGLSQGRFEVVKDARSGRKTLLGLDADRLQGLQGSPAGTRSLRGPSLAAPDGAVPLDRLLNRVRDLVQDAGEGGGR